MSSADEPPGSGLVLLVPLWGGESVGLVGEIEPAGEIVRRIAREADEVIARLGS